MKNPTYVVTCRRGLNRLTCPLVQQQGIHCVECGNALYVRREPISQPTEETEVKPETESEQKQND